MSKHSIDELRKVFDYDPDTGRLWRKDLDEEAAKSAAQKVSYDGVKYHSRRLVWALHHGRWPDARITLANGDPWDLRADNLILVGNGHEPTAKELREVFSYNRETGMVTRRRSGKEVGYADKTTGYRRIDTGAQVYAVHRLIWLLETGEWPEDQIDHINGVRDDNRLVNLRAVERQVNLQNKKRYKDRVFRTGVGFDKSSVKWRAYISVEGSRKWLGRFDDYDSAVEARIGAEKKYGFHDNHGLHAHERAVR